MALLAFGQKRGVCAAFSDRPTIPPIDRGEQRRRAIALALVRDGARTGLAQRGRLHPKRHVHRDRWRAAVQAALDAFTARLAMTLRPARNLSAATLARQFDDCVLQARRFQPHSAGAQAGTTSSGAGRTLNPHTGLQWTCALG
jgi:hypothetical protein